MNDRVPLTLQTLRSLSLTAILFTGASPAAAQESILVAPPSPIDSDRGRNTSVLEKARPEYDALGIRSGGFLVYPQLALGAGATDNVYLTDARKRDDVYASVATSVLAQSDWSRHQLSAFGNLSARRYADETRRNYEEWNANLLGRADVSSELAVVGELQAARTQESPFTTSVLSDIAALSSYRRNTAVIRGQYTSQRTRVTLAYDFNDLEFNDVVFAGGMRRSQADRDRAIHRGTGQVEFAVSPSLSVYGQLSYARTDYDRGLLTGERNRDSDAGRVLVGVNFDVSAFMRGRVGAGYVQRNYRSSLYQDNGGLSVEGQVEYFPTELATVTVAIRRLLDDSNIGFAGALFDNRATLRLDYELRYNLLVNASTALARQDYIGSPLSTDVFRTEVGARYLASRSLQLLASTGFGSRRDRGVGASGSINELTVEFGVKLQR